MKNSAYYHLTVRIIYAYRKVNKNYKKYNIIIDNYQPVRYYDVIEK
nr:MAG TPA: hypothetical protein [Caudoviricetes sp.]